MKDYWQETAMKWIRASGPSSLSVDLHSPSVPESAVAQIPN